MRFRQDINGLRAVAIIGVILFHFNHEWLPGGFSGVDVFFVISGFLMTSIVVRGLDNDSFSLFKFYVSRANRIIPALAFLCLVLMIFGWFYLAPGDYKTLGKHALSSMEFSSNFTYLNESGYFDKSVYTKWLLHTWSLSVEWQFYILFPIILMILKKYLNIQNLKKVFLISTIFAFFIALFLSYINPLSAFYLLPARAWELLLGGVAFLYPLVMQNKNKKRIELLGVSLIILGYFLITNETIWPGYMALIPVIGTYLIIVSNRQNSLLTNNFVLQYIGKWSYSIYLWHWPLVVLGVYFSIANWWLIGIPLSIFLGYLSYRYIESIKFSSYDSWSSILKVKPVWMFLFTGVIAAGAYNSNGYEFHYSQELQVIGKESFNGPSRALHCQNFDNQKECQFGKGKVAAIVMGDSHSGAMIRAIDVLYHDKGAVVDWTLGACPTLSGVSRYRQKKWTSVCGDHVDSAIKRAGSKYQGVPIFIINRTAYYIDGGTETDRLNDQTILVKWKNEIFRPSSTLEMKSKLAKGFIETACKFAKTNPIIMVRDTPEYPVDVPTEMQKSLILNGVLSRVKISRELFSERNKWSDYIRTQAQKECGVKVLDLTDVFCDQDYCYGDKNGHSLYIDGDHLSPYGSSLTIPLMNEKLKSMNINF